MSKIEKLPMKRLKSFKKAKNNKLSIQKWQHSPIKIENNMANNMVLAG